MNVALIGPSGVGLGTQARGLVEREGMAPFSTGNMLRANLSQGTALGLMARNYIKQGELVPDELVDAMVEEWLRKSAPDAGIVFDGFPRTEHQAQFLDKLLVELGRNLDRVVLFEAPDQTILERLTGRLVCTQCHAAFHREFKPPAMSGICDFCGGALCQRDDDRPEIIKVRLRSFRRAIVPVMEYYQRTHRLAALDARATPEALLIQLLELLRSPQSAAILGPRITPPLPPTPRPSRGEKLLDFVLLGGPGSGKGTQAELLRSHLEVPHISTGELFRDHLRQQSSLGKLAKSFMERGELVPDDVTEAMVESRLAEADAARGFILDGFPRTLPQAEALNDMLNELGRELAGVLYFEVPDKDIVQRLGGRLLCRECQAPYHRTSKRPAVEGVCDRCGGALYQRADDNPATIEARLRTFHAQTEPLIAYYRRAGVLRVVNGTGTVEEIGLRARDAVETLVEMEAVHV